MLLPSIQSSFICYILRMIGAEGIAAKNNDRALNAEIVYTIILYHNTVKK